MKPSNSLFTTQASANFGLIAIVLLLNGIAVHRNGVALRDTHSLVVHTHDVLNQAEQIFIGLVDAESSARGFVITGDESYLDIFRREVESQDEQFQELRRRAVADKGIQMSNAKFIQQEASLRIQQLGLVVRARMDQGADAARIAVLNGEGKQTMDGIRKVIKDLEAEDQRLAKERLAGADEKLYSIVFANVIGVFLSLVFSGVAWILIERQIRKCQEAEAKAESERENLLVTLTSIGDAVVVTDSQGRIQVINPVAKQLMAVTDDLVGRPLRDEFSLVNQLTRQPVKDPVSSVLESENPADSSAHLMLIRSDGSEVPIEKVATPIKDKLGKIKGVVLVFRDCSDRWRYEKELMSRERRFRKMFETPMLGIAVGTSDGRTLLEANDAFLDLIGYDRGELSDSSLGWDGVDAGQSPLDSAAIEQLRETGVCRPFEKVYTRSDGTSVPVLISSTRLFDDEDRVIVFMTDLTGAKKSEAALRDSENRFQILSESMPQMVWMALPNGQFDYVNHTMVQYSGRSVEELIGWGWTNLLHSEEREKLIEFWQTALKTGQPFEVEHRLRGSDGNYRWHLTRARSMYDANERVMRWVGTNTDIDDHKQIETLLKDEHTRKDRFLALLAHELRNPLAPLANAVQVFGSIKTDPVQSAELIAIMQRQLKQMTRLIDDLLDIARITQDRIQLRRERIEVSSVVAAAVEAVQPWIKDRSHQLTVEVPTTTLWIDADAARLSQVLTNLLQNAAKYTEPGGQISLITVCVDNTVQFRVRDNGPGLSAAMLTSIFDLFTQVEQTLDRSQGGLGIGLTLVRALVELHGGQVTAHSDGLGNGSEFVVILPLIQAPSSMKSSSIESPHANADQYSRLNAMIVDDVKASAKTLALILSSLGPKVTTAFDGLSAMQKIDDGSFDIVFLDIAMPGMDGLEVAKRVRSNPNLSGVFLVALTGFGQEGDRQRSREAGFNEHLIKPVSMSSLCEVLERAVKAKQQQLV